MPIDPRAVLDTLDAANRDAVFPVMDNGYVYPAATRLTVLSDAERWAMVFEIVGYNARQPGCSGFDTCAYLFGNCVKQVRRPFAIWFPIPEQSSELVRSEIVVARPRSLVVGGGEVPFPDAADLAAAGVVLRRGEPLHAAGLLRALAFRHRDRLLATPERLRSWIVTDEVPPVVLQLDEWRHPGITAGESPSAVASIRQLAEVAASGDATRYRPQERPNTHWRHWPEAGTL